MLQVWRTVSIALITFILGAGIPMFINRTAATKEDMTSAIIPVQKQLDDLAMQNGAHQKSIEQLDVDVARIATKMNITARPIP